MSRILILGATSAIVHEIAKHYAAQNSILHLVARNSKKLSLISHDLRVRGSQTHEIVDECASVESALRIFETLQPVRDQIDTVVIGYGNLPDDTEALSDTQIRSDTIQINFLSVLEHALIWFNFFQKNSNDIKRKIVVISSVAGDRGRSKNVIYSCAKAGISSFLSSLRCRGLKCGIQVITVLPGFVDTPMTSHIKKGILFASAESVGASIFKGIKRNKDVLYVPSFWFMIMFIIKNIPERIFKRLSF